MTNPGQKMTLCHNISQAILSVTLSYCSSVCVTCSHEILNEQSRSTRLLQPHIQNQNDRNPSTEANDTHLPETENILFAKNMRLHQILKY